MQTKRSKSETSFYSEISRNYKPTWIPNFLTSLDLHIILFAKLFAIILFLYFYMIIFSFSSKYRHQLNNGEACLVVAPTTHVSRSISA